MYLTNADNLEEILQYGIIPLKEMIDLFEDYFLNQMDNEDFSYNSKEYILLQEIKGKINLIKHVSETNIKTNNSSKNI